MTDKRRNSHTHVRRTVLKTIGAAGVATTFGSGAVIAQSDRQTIEDWHDLHHVRDSLDEDYELVADLKAETDGYEEHITDHDGGWQPIGDRNTPFQGTFDGRGYVIDRLRIDRSRSEGGTGLFGTVGEEGRVRNTALVDVDVTGSTWVGGFVGEVWGELERSFASGSVTGRRWVGGLVGNNDGTIKESFASGTITADSDVGGLVGQTDGPVEESFASGSVTGEEAVGGLVGGITGPVSESFAVTEVDGDSAVGGLVGEKADASPITAGYWDIESTGQEEGIGSGEGDAIGLTTAEMGGATAEESMSALNFAETWETVRESDPDASTDGYPILQSLDRINQIESQRIANTEASNDSVPGFGIGTGVAALGAAGYMLKRRFVYDSE